MITESARAISRAPRELWIIYALKLLSSYAYFSFSLILTLYLSSELGFSDSSAGLIYGSYGLLSTVYGFLTGWLIDRLGVRRSLLLGALLGTAARVLLALSTSGAFVVGLLTTVLPLSECLGIPVMTISIKRYTNEGNRTLAYSLFYTFMNVAALLAGPAVDLCRAYFRLQTVFLTGAVASFALALTAQLALRDIEVDVHGNVSEFKSPHEDHSPLASIRRIVCERTFWRLLVFMLLLAGARLVFRHLDATLPKYMVRVFGEAAPFGAFYAINPAIVITLVPFIGAFARGVGHFRMILYGSFLSGASVFWMMAGDHYWTVALFVVTLSIGEAVYSPRVYDYTMALAGRGSEGLYTSLASLPLFGVQFFAGWMSGALLEWYCPADAAKPRRTRLLWLIVALSSAWSPVAMAFWRNWLEGDGEAGEEGDGHGGGRGEDEAEESEAIMAMETDGDAARM